MSQPLKDNLKRLLTTLKGFSKTEKQIDCHGTAIFMEKASLNQGGKERLKEVSLALAPGRLMAVYAYNANEGALFMELLSGLKPVDKGSYLLLGQNMKRKQSSIFAKAAYVSGKLPGLGKWTLRRAFLYESALCGLTRRQGEERLKSLALKFGLAARLDSRTKELSPLEYATSCLAVSLVRSPLILLVALPKKNLDTDQERQWWNLLGRARDEGATVVALANGLESPWRVSDRFMLIKEGLAFFPGPEELAKLKGLSGSIVIRLEAPPKILPPELAALHPEIDGPLLKIPMADPASHVVEIVEILLNAGLTIEDLVIKGPAGLAEALMEGGNTP